MSVDLKQSEAATLRLAPQGVDRFSSPSAVLRTPAGAVAASPTVTVDTTSTTVADADTPAECELSSATGFVVGRLYRVQLPSGYAVARLDRLDGVVARWLYPLPEVPEAGATVEAVEVSVALTSEHTATRGKAFRLVVSESGRGDASETVNIVRQPLGAVVTSHDVRGYVSATWPSSSLLRSEERLAEVADRACQRIRNRLLTAQRYADLYLDTQAFMEVGRISMRLELVSAYNLMPPGANRDDVERSLIFEFRDRLGEVVSSLTPYDANDDGNLESEPNRIKSIQLRR